MLAGKQTGVVEDYSMYWRNSEHSHGTRAALALVEQLLRADDAERTKLIDLVAGKVWPAFFFGMIAQRAVHDQYKRTALAFRWLADPVFLDRPSTHAPAGEYLKKFAAQMPPAELERIETHLVESRAAWFKEHTAEHEPTHLAQKLGSIPKEALVTDAAKEWRAKLDAAGGPPKNEEDFRVTTGVRGMRKWEWFEREGIDIKDPTIASALELSDAMDVLAERGERERDEEKKLTRQDGIGALPTIVALRDLLATRELPRMVRNRALARLTAGAAQAAAVALDVEELVLHARGVITIAAGSPDEEREHEHGGGSGTDADPQREAAHGILRLVSALEQATDADRALISSLARANDARVRARIAGWLHSLYYAAPDLMWALFEERTGNETDNFTLAVMMHSLDRVIGNEHVDRAATLAARVLARSDITKAKKNNDARAEWAELAAMLGVWRDNATARAAADKLVEDVHANREELFAILAALRTSKALTVDKDGVRARAHALMLGIARALDTQKPKLRLVAGDEDARRRHELEDQIVNQLLFACNNVDDDGDLHDADTMARFFRDAGPTIELLSRRELHDQAPRYFAQLLVHYGHRDASKAVRNVGAYFNANPKVIADVTMSVTFINFFTTVTAAEDLTKAAKDEAIAALDLFIKSGVPAASQFSDLAQKIARR